MSRCGATVNSQDARAECNYGTTGFRNHLRSAHSIVKGQLQLKAEKDHGKDVTTFQRTGMIKKLVSKSSIWQ
jgi:hypothetical protein